MDYPKDWRSLGGKCTQVGHQEQGRTIALHSLAVSPKVQGCGIGQIIVKSYLQQMNNSGLADRVSLICQDVRAPLQERRNSLVIKQYLVSYYERFGFTNKGPSDAQYGGGGWHNMVSLPRSYSASHLFVPTSLDDKSLTIYGNNTGF